EVAADAGRGGRAAVDVAGSLRALRAAEAAPGAVGEAAAGAAARAGAVGAARGAVRGMTWLRTKYPGIQVRHSRVKDRNGESVECPGASGGRRRCRRSYRVATATNTAGRNGRA